MTRDSGLADSVTPSWVQDHFPSLTHVAAVARGGHKCVFSAVHPADGAVVVKVLAPDQHLDYVTRLTRAVQQMSSARVPAIFEIQTCGTDAGDVLCVREAQVAGETLREVMGRGPLDKVTAQRVAIDILDALVDCEHARIVHRDVKPENIAIDRRGACWLLDFDVALQVELAATTPGAAAAGWGTPGYAAPEQLTQSIGPVDARADLFGLGVTLHEACSGRHPLLAGARDVRDVVTRTLSMPVPRMCVRWDRAGAFADVVSAFTRIRREDRPPSAQDALEAMKRAVARRPGSLDA